MLLTFHATCSDAEGHLLDSARLSGILVELRDGELTRIVTPVADQDGTLVIGAPMGVFSLADGRPGFDPDDDFDASEEEVQR